MPLSASIQRPALVAACALSALWLLAAPIAAPAAAEEYRLAQAGAIGAAAERRRQGQLVERQLQRQQRWMARRRLGLSSGPLRPLDPRLSTRAADRSAQGRAEAADLRALARKRRHALRPPSDAGAILRRSDALSGSALPGSSLSGSSLSGSARTGAAGAEPAAERVRAAARRRAHADSRAERRRPPWPRRLVDRPMPDGPR